MKKVAAGLSLLFISIFALSGCASSQQKPAPKPTTAPGNIQELKLTQVGNQVSVQFSDPSQFRNSNSYVVSWRGSATGSYARAGSESGNYKVTTPAMVLGKVAIEVYLKNEFGNGPTSSDQINLSGPGRATHLSLTQSSGTSIDVSWDQGSGPVPSYYLVTWNGSGKGSEKVTETSYSIDATSGRTLSVTVTPVIAGFKSPQPASSSIKVSEPWNTSPDGSELQWRKAGGYCQGYSSYGCVRIQIYATADCLRGVYSEANNLDANNNVTGYSNDSLGSLSKGQSAILEMDFTEPGGYYQITHLTCHNY